MKEHNADTLEEAMSLIQLLIKDATAHSMVAVLLRAALCTFCQVPDQNQFLGFAQLNRCIISGPACWQSK